MSDIITNLYKNRKADFEKLVLYGFEKNGADFVYSQELSENDFVMAVTVTSFGEISATVIDRAADEPYTLHLAEGAAGSFVGGIRMEYEEILNDIAEKCFQPDIFKTEHAKQLITYVRENYGDELEFLWKKFPQNAIWRRKDTKKWYGALLTVSKRKLGIPSDEMVEIIDLRLEPEKLEKLIDNTKYYAGYHMNKKHWYTMILDGSVPVEEIYWRIEDSYRLANKK